MSGQGPAVRRPTPHPRYERPYCDSRSFPSSAVIVHRPRPVTTPPGSSTDRGKPSCRPRLARSRAGPRTTNKVTGGLPADHDGLIRISRADYEKYFSHTTIGEAP